MGRQLFAAGTCLSAAVLECDQVMQKQFRRSIVEELSLTTRTPGLTRNSKLRQPTIFAVQLGLSACGNPGASRPDAVVGHSMGEVAAAPCRRSSFLSDALTSSAIGADYCRNEVNRLRSAVAMASQHLKRRARDIGSGGHLSHAVSYDRVGRDAPGLPQAESPS